ncbi:hypothetical protein F5B20DRAFT_596282 [Whalleya microplaca]|nr:hypothetical protein F5B20DRAFT_596282 [Whalleya microplaca]
MSSPTTPEVSHHTAPFPFTLQNDSTVPSLTSPQATSLANILVHLSHNTLPPPSDLPNVLNAYSARDGAQRPWAYFHPSILDIPTLAEQEDDQRPDRPVLPASIAHDVQLGWGGRARYRLLAFVHRHRPRFQTRGSDAEIVYSLSVWDRAQRERTHYDFRAAGGEERSAAVRAWWGRVGTVVEDGSATAPQPQFTALANMERSSPVRFDARTTVYAVLAAGVELMNNIDSVGRLTVTDDEDTATGLGIELLPKLYEHLFLMLRAQPSVQLGRMARNAHRGEQYNGQMFHHPQWLNEHLAVIRIGSLFRQRLRDRLLARVPLTLGLGTVDLLTRRDLSEYAGNN